MPSGQTDLLIKFEMATDFAKFCKFAKIFPFFLDLKLFGTARVRLSVVRDSIEPG